MNHMLRKWIAAGVALAIAALLTGAFAGVYAQDATTLEGRSIHNVNIRATPGVTSAVIAVLPGGAEVTAIGRSPANNWIQIEYDATTGWVASWLLVFSGDTSLLPVTTDIQPPPVDGPGPFNVLSPYNVNIRAAPDVEAAKLGVLPYSTEALATGRNEASSWVRIKYQNLEGWVAAWLVILNGDITALPVSTSTVPTTPTTTATPGPTPTPGGTLPPSPTGITVFTPFRVNVRSTPTIDGPILDVLSAGTTVNAIGRNAGNNWLQVEYGSTTGWVAVWVVMASDATSALPVTDSSAAVAVVGFDLYGRGIYDLVMRAGPDLNYGPLATIPAGTEVLLLARTADSDWLKASYQGTEGWLAAWVVVGNADFNNLEVEEEPTLP
jgi:uncharacterized protein YraI